MIVLKMKYAAGVAVVGLAVVAAMPAQAEIKDYEFRLTQSEIKKGDAAIVSAELVDKRSGAKVGNAVIFAKRLDMAPDGMETMTAPVELVPPTASGLYRFKADIPMAGGWRLSIQAKVQGESGTLESKLPFKAVP